MEKMILIKPRYKNLNVHSLYNEIIENPPEGLKFVLEKYENTKILQKIDNKSTNSLLKELFFYTKPIPYLISQKLQNNNFDNYDLILASQHVLFNSEKPWAVDLEFANTLAAYGELRLIKNSIQKTLEKNECKCIIPWSFWAKETLESSLDCKNIKEKIKVIHYTVSKKNSIKEKHEKIVFLFVGSTNPINSKNIQFKNLREVIIAFQNISKKYDNIELIIRSYLTPELQILSNRCNKIKIINQSLPKMELNRLYSNSDIFVLPSHETCGIALLDAMSFGLAVISMKIYDIPEYIINMKNGLLINPPDIMKYYSKTKNPLDYSIEFMKGIKKSSDYLVEQLEKYFVLLVENSSLRNKLGKEARNSIENGELSIQKRNKQLKEALDN